MQVVQVVQVVVGIHIVMARVEPLEALLVLPEAIQLEVLQEVIQLEALQEVMLPVEQPAVQLVVLQVELSSVEVMELPWVQMEHELVVATVQ